MMEILSDVFWVMATAIVSGGALMIWLSDRVASFLEKNRMYEVLGLFILMVVGIMLLTEGGHLAHLKLFGHEIAPMSKALSTLSSPYWCSPTWCRPATGRGWNISATARRCDALPAHSRQAPARSDRG